MIPNATLTYQILCNTNFRAIEIGAAVDMQIISNATSLKECLDACALYSFQTPSMNFPALGCSGAVCNDNNAVPDCWLKRRLILSESDNESGQHAAILLFG